MGRLLCELAAKEDYRLATLDGGSRDTAIAASATAQIVVEDTKAAAVCDIIKALGVQYASEYATAEPNMAVDATCMKTGSSSLFIERTLRFGYMQVIDSTTLSL